MFASKIRRLEDRKLEDDFGTEENVLYHNFLAQLERPVHTAC
jgi:hypothetical protein